ncbi:hypothetical protein [Secundilactobacillus malefermentans]|uniref:Uncharacterized protein n=1 Tax=Secundilactobacillus malefermentans TaxID=176292 RepID=A0A4R5NGZ3_9LACO|nr:hypothetical protein [Secundilactobacillus malefermentans]KRM57572.1 hypothetical protein FD44_GL001087 [Secundilactobacillus malefermentans DSM 5705 = KCTC 3548]QEA31164.1 hypothetical protein FGL90_02710 [Secundilactobacillus malefermentans]TDG72942.1 hypothetical protein C5L31_000267 [Secundilactobacillus malefermentans]
MNSILTDLKYAQSKQFLVNIFQKNQEVVYTGYVTALDQVELVLQTYSDTGLSDGAVYLNLDIIDEVEFDSDDLNNMDFRINNASEENLIDLNKIKMTFATDQPLLAQVLNQAVLNDWVIMVMDKSRSHFYEGQIVKLASDHIELAAINKFNYSDNKIVTLEYADISLIEFQGRELTLQALIMPQLTGLSHRPSERASTLADRAEKLSFAQKNDTFIAIIPDGDPQMFFVGKVNSMNDTGVVFNLVDMSGQFGGYVLMRLQEIREVIVESDYLQTVKLLVNTNERIGTELQPVLNDERLFDDTTDFFVAVLGQESAFKRVLQIRLKDGDSIVGYPSEVTNERIIFHEIEQNQITDAIGKSIPIADITQIGFDYLEAHLIEQQLKQAGDL